MLEHFEAQNTPSEFTRGMTDHSEKATREISAALNALLADVFALYVKTKNFHWHMSGPSFRDYHRMLDVHATQILAMTDPIAERVRKVGGATIRSIGHIARLQKINDNDVDSVEAGHMLAELQRDNLHLTSLMRQVHATCVKHGDVATTSRLEVWIDEAEERTWFLYEATRPFRG